MGLQFPILYDPDADVVISYQAFNLLRDGLATPSTFLVDKAGNVRWKYVGKGRSDRPTNKTIIAKLKELS